MRFNDTPPELTTHRCAVSFSPKSWVIPCIPVDGYAQGIKTDRKKRLSARGAELPPGNGTDKSPRTFGEVIRFFGVDLTVEGLNQTHMGGGWGRLGGVHHSLMTMA